MKNNSEYFKSLKKANCHLHITGSLRPSDLRLLAKITNFDIAPYEPLEQHMGFYDPTIWAVAKEITSTAGGLSEAIKIILTREADDNVVYVELTINPAGMVRRGMTNHDITTSIEEGFAHGKNLGITSKVKFGVNRKDGPDSVAVVRDVFNATPEDMRAYIDLNGDERKFPTSHFIDSFSRLTSARIPVSVHAGECAGLSQSLEEAIAISPKRIAHAVAIEETEEAINLFLKKEIVLEASLISNLKTGAISDITKHPIREFINAGVPVVFGSDNPAIFGTTLSSELECLVDASVDVDKVEELNQQTFILVGIDLKK